jgi:hypothetical protein
VLHREEGLHIHELLELLLFLFPKVLHHGLDHIHVPEALRGLLLLVCDVHQGYSVVEGVGKARNILLSISCVKGRQT